MQVVLNAPQSFEKLSSQERENLIQELQEELKLRSINGSFYDLIPG